MVEQVHHKWRIVGREYQSNIPNIWRCSKCGLVRSEGWTTKPPRGSHRWDVLPCPDGKEYWLKEYSNAIGKVLSNNTKVPQCVAGAYK